MARKRSNKRTMRRSMRVRGGHPYFQFTPPSSAPITAQQIMQQRPWYAKLEFNPVTGAKQGGTRRRHRGGAGNLFRGSNPSPPIICQANGIKVPCTAFTTA